VRERVLTIRAARPTPVSFRKLSTHTLYAEMPPRLHAQPEDDSQHLIGIGTFVILASRLLNQECGGY